MSYSSSARGCNSPSAGQRERRLCLGFRQQDWANASISVFQLLVLCLLAIGLEEKRPGRSEVRICATPLLLAVFPSRCVSWNDWSGNDWSGTGLGDARESHNNIQRDAGKQGTRRHEMNDNECLSMT